jgi:hypothetical protein
LPLIAASVRTHVVSSKEAAEMNESVDSEALVMPSSVGLSLSPDGRRPPAPGRSLREI